MSDLANLSADWWQRLDRDECPRCGEPLDTGWECTVTSRACGFDAQPLVVSRQAKIAALNTGGSPNE